MRSLVARQFRAHAGEKDLDKVELLKRNAMGGLANYLTMESLGKLEVQGGSGANSGFRDPARTAANVRKSLGCDALPESEVAEATTAAAQVAASSSSSASAASNARADRRGIPEAEYTPVASQSVAALQAQLRANKSIRLELERKAREGLIAQPAAADSR